MKIEAKLTLNLIEEMSKLNMTPAEVVGRAMEIAERAVEEMTALGWMDEE
tara:strand:- start:969 stop:1118 length:150 start_codon:yes stop_codon:yes gene_type:complete